MIGGAIGIGLLAAWAWRHYLAVAREIVEARSRINFYE